VAYVRPLRRPTWRFVGTRVLEAAGITTGVVASCRW